MHFPLRFASLLVLTLALILASSTGCSRSRRGRSTVDSGLPPGDGSVGRDGGTTVPPGPLADFIAASEDVAGATCPCLVMMGAFSSVEACLLASAPSSTFQSCAASIYPSARTTELDSALTCRETQGRALIACVDSMGCAGVSACFESTTPCPESAALDSFQSAVSECGSSTPPDAGIDSGPGTCTIRSAGSTVGPSVFSGATAGTSAQGGTCGGTSAPEDVYDWTAPSGGSFTIDTIGSSYDTVLYVRSDSCTGTELACNDDASGVQSSVVVSASAGQHLFIVVDGFSSSSGSYIVNITAGSAG